MNTFLLFLFTFSIIIPNQAATINNQDSLTKESYVKVLWQDNILPDTKQASENTASSNVPNWLLISGLLGILGSALTWLYNEWQKRINRLRQEKEARYKKLISLIRSFGVGAFNHEKANEFIVEFQLCWMYCPDITSCIKHWGLSGYLKFSAPHQLLQRQTGTKPAIPNVSYM
jgi:hypothetical protein